MTTLAEELKSRQLNLMPHQEAFLSLLVTANRLTSRHEDAFYGFGISSKQYNILRILRGASVDGLPVMEIGRRMIERAPDISRIIDRLLEAGFVETKRQRADRRVVIVTIAEKGLKKLDDMDEPVEQIIRAMMNGLSPEETSMIIDLLDKVRDSLYAQK